VALQVQVICVAAWRGSICSPLHCDVFEEVNNDDDDDDDDDNEVN